MYVVYPTRRMTVTRRVYLPSERVQVSAEGLGSLEGFNVGKMFSRMVKITPKSFTFKNIMGAVGSVVSNFATL
jgi:hypothetical protein